ncbi:MAG: glycosyltransferase family 2 protein [Thermodesulfobacteriota bacterium]
MNINITNLVSVILPTFNRSNFITFSINSLLSQTYKNIEIIVVDDGSTDETEHIIKLFNDSRIRYIKLDDNHGANFARNIGLRNALGEFVTFLDSDDEFMVLKIEKELNVLLTNKSIGLVYSGLCQYHVDDAKKENLRTTIPKFRGDIYNEILYRNVIGTPSPLIRKECFEKVGFFDETMKSCQDWEMWIRISKHYKVEYLNEPFMFMCVHGNQISTNLEFKIQGMETILNKYKPYMKDKNKLSSFMRKIGIFHSLNNNKRQSIIYLSKTIKLFPLNYLNYFHLILVSISITIHKNLVKRLSLLKVGDTYLYY